MGPRAREFRDALAELTEEQYDDWNLGDDISSLLNFLGRMNSDGMSPVPWTEAYFMRKIYGEGDRPQHQLRCTARVLEVAPLYDQLNATSLASFELLCRRAQLIIGGSCP